MTKLRSTARVALLAMGIGLCGLLTGCGGVRFPGRVVAGPASIATVVPATDPRLKGEGGVGGVTVVLLDDKQNEYGSGVSAPDGAFEITVPTASAPTRPATVRVSGPGVAASDTLLYLPRDGSSILVNVRRDPSAAGAGTSGQ